MEIKRTSSISLASLTPIPPISTTFLSVGLAKSRNGSELVRVNEELAMISCMFVFYLFFFASLNDTQSSTKITWALSRIRETQLILEK